MRVVKGLPEADWESYVRWGTLARLVIKDEMQSLGSQAERDERHSL